jgi:hypothetical protein
MESTPAGQAFRLERIIMADVSIHELVQTRGKDNRP